MKFSYNSVALVFDIIDKIFFRLGKNNPRKAIYNLIPNSNINILDVCTGTGSNVIKIAKDKPNVKITGIDNSQGMLSVGLKKISKYKLTTRVGFFGFRFPVINQRTYLSSPIFFSDKIIII